MTLTSHKSCVYNDQAVERSQEECCKTKVTREVIYKVISHYPTRDPQEGLCSRELEICY